MSIEIDPEGSPFVERKLGKFSVPMGWLEGMTNKVFQAVFQHFRILRAEFDYVHHAMMYVAASEYFDEVAEGTEPGSYSIQVDAPSKANEACSIRVVRTA
jgi:hypothetical protein